MNIYRIGYNLNKWLTNIFILICILILIGCITMIVYKLIYTNEIIYHSPKIELVRGDCFKLIIDDDNPFIGPKIFTYTVISTKGGWVKYKVSSYNDITLLEEIKYCKEEDFIKIIKN